MSAETLSYKNLIAGTFPRQTEKICILNSAALLAGSVLGKITVGTLAAAGAAIAGNTGSSGAITATPAVAAGSKLGVYKLFCIEPGTNAGKFIMHDPDGVALGIVTVAVEATLGGITFTIADATDFVSGDGFTITVTAAAGSGKYKLSALAATDGSQNPCAILLEAADAAGQDAYGVVALSGCFNEGALTFGTDQTLALSRAALAALNIYVVSADNNVTV